MLIHCVSGWDRTPLFVSLLRLSLWAVSHGLCYMEPVHYRLPWDQLNMSRCPDFPGDFIVRYLGLQLSV